MLSRFSLLVLVFLGFQIQTSSAQSSHFSGDLSFGIGDKVSVFAASINRSHTLLNEKLVLGYGFRVNLHSGKEQTFVTAPFEYTKEDLLDSLTTTKNSVIAMNFGVHAGYSITPKLMLGFNIDVIGFSFGGNDEIAGLRYSAEFPDNAFMGAITQTKPTGMNVLLVGDNDIGNLNSEFYARYMLTDNLGVRAGLSMFFAELTTTDAEGFDGNDRFRNKISYPFVAVTLKL